MSLYTVSLIIHVSCGFSALISGAFAMLLNRNTRKHKVAGKFYYYAMIGVFITMLPIYYLKGNQILFLFLVGVFSLYLTLTGKRFLTLANKASNIRWYDYLVLSISMLAAGYMLILGMLTKSGFSILLLVFGGILMLNIVHDCRFIMKVKRGVKGLRKPVMNHVSRMGGAYIATFTAFTVNNLNGVLPGLIGWLLPTVVGTLLINLTMRRLKRKNKRTKVVVGV